ncbi:MAG: PDZ domain-containing protein [Lachnospiraceae bacterium]|nr:PDZ domain-containing protein [Lachnospiraceae bacterium]
MGNDFLKEDIKKRPVNRGKIIKKTLITIAMAVIFGVVASLMILVLEPFLKRITTGYDQPAPDTVSLPEEEMSPEEMLSEYMMQESALAEMMEEEETAAESEPVDIPLSEDQISAILSRLKIDATKYRQMMISMSNYARELGDYAVTITAVKSSVDWLNSVNDSSNVTSGIVVAENNVELLILADSAPIKNADSLTMSLRNGLTFPAYIKDIDDITGLAVIGVSMELVPEDFDVASVIAPLGSSSSIYTGMGVVAIGSPEGVPGSIGYGMINTPRTMVSYVDTYLYSYETDILASKNSSGVIFNMQGQVVGIITNKETGTNGNVVVVAYGVTELKSLIEKMSNGQKISYLGISGTNVTSEANRELGVPMGAFVTGTEMDSPAMLAGVQVGDIIVGINDTNIGSFADYVSALQKRTPEEQITLKIMRKSVDEYVTIDIPLTIAARE